MEKKVDIILNNIYSLSSFNIFSCLSSLKSRIIARIIRKNETLLFLGTSEISSSLSPNGVALWPVTSKDETIFRRIFN